MCFVTVIVYGFMAILLLQKIKMGSSLVDRRMQQWMAVLIGCYLAEVLIAFIYLFVYAITDESELLWLSDSVISILIGIVLLWKGLELKILVKENQNQSIGEGPSAEGRWLSLFNDIDARVKQDELYLQQDLRINDLAKAMGSNSKYISKAINTGAGESISNYLNGIRLAQFKAKFQDQTNAHINLDALTKDCGFSSKSSFNRFFKTQEGITIIE